MFGCACILSITGVPFLLKEMKNFFLSHLASVNAHFFCDKCDKMSRK